MRARRAARTSSESRNGVCVCRCARASNSASVSVPGASVASRVLPVYTPLVGLALMVFFAIACQCMSTLAVVKRETRSWTWPTFLFIYTGALAWLLSFAVFQGGRLLGFG